MLRILKANLRRLMKSGLFIAGAALTAVISLVNVISSCINAERLEDLGYLEHNILAACFFDILPFLGLFVSVITSMHQGAEYSFGTMRNKLISGRTRGQVYAAYLLSGMTASLAVTAVSFLFGLAGFFLLPQWGIDGKTTAVLFAAAFLLMCAYSSFFTLIVNALQSRSAAAVCCIFMFLLLLVSGAAIYNALCEPEMISGIEVTAEGMQMTEPHPNPSYIGGSLRTALEVLLNILPSGQAILIANLELSSPWLNMLASAVIILVFSAWGAAAFQKKDTK